MVPVRQVATNTPLILLRTKSSSAGRSRGKVLVEQAEDAFKTRGTSPSKRLHWEDTRITVWRANARPTPHATP